MPPNPMKPFPPRSYPDASPSSSVLHDKLAGHQQASRLPSSSMKPHKKRVLDKEATLVVKDDPEDGGFSEEEGRKKKRKKRQKSKSRESSVHEDSLPKSDRVGTSTPPSHPAHSGQVSKKIKLESPVIAKWSERKGPREARIVTSPIAPSHLAGKSHNNGPTKGMSKSQTQQSQQHVKVEREKERNDHRVQLVQRQMAMLKEEAEKIKENADSRTAKAEKEAAALRSKLEGVERELKGLKSADEERVKAVQNHDQLKDSLREALTCGICFESFSDPHILACGHMGCKDCLLRYFRTGGAYMHGLDGVPDHQDLSYFRKVCHVCRKVCLSRPARMYHLQGILEPLDIDPHLPSESQETRERENDPWKGIFPAEKTTYRIEDEEDAVSRCPECFEEIAVDTCSRCGLMFSEPEDDMRLDDLDDMDSLMDSDEGTDSEMEAELGIRGGQLRRRLARSPDDVADIVRGLQDRHAARRAARAALLGGDEEDGAQAGARRRQLTPGLELEEDGADREERRRAHRERRLSRMLDVEAEDDEFASSDGMEDLDGDLASEDYEASFIDDEEEVERQGSGEFSDREAMIDVEADDSDMGMDDMSDLESDFGSVQSVHLRPRGDIETVAQQTEGARPRRARAARIILDSDDE